MARKLGTILMDMGYIDEDALWKILDAQKASPTGELTGQVAVRLGLVTEEQVLKALSEQLGMKVQRLPSDLTIPQEAVAAIDKTMAQAFKVVPFTVSKKDKSVTVVMAEPQNPATLESLSTFLGVPVHGLIGLEQEVKDAQERIYAGKQETFADVIQEIANDKNLAQYANRNENTIDIEAIEEMAEAAPVRKLINMVLLLSIRDKASDIHFEPFEEEYKMRYRVDGVLYELVPPPATSPRRSPRGSKLCPTWISPNDGCLKTAASNWPWAATPWTSGSPPCPPSLAKAWCCGSSTALWSTSTCAKSACRRTPWRNGWNSSRNPTASS